MNPAREIVLLAGNLILLSVLAFSGGCTAAYDTRPLVGAKQSLPQESAAKKCEAYARADKNIDLTSGFKHCMAQHGWEVSFSNVW